MRQTADGDAPAGQRRYNRAVQKKIFWLLVVVLGLIADFALPLIWGMVATVPIILISWWIVYRTDWFY